MINNPYTPNIYNSQPSVERINAQIAELENMKRQVQQPIQQPTNLTQNFQLAPNSNSFIRYANSMEDVEKSMVTGETPFFSNDMSIVWIKKINGEIKTYELNEIVKKDEKDLKIELLMAQIEELKKGSVDNESYVKYNDESTTNAVESKKSASVSNGKSSNAKQK